MKRVTALLLAVVLCLSLAACGGEPKDTEAPERTTTAEDAGVQENDTTTEEPTGTEEISTEAGPELTEEAKMWLERIPGEYVGTDFGSGTGTRFPSFVMNADKTCTLGDASYTWDLAIAWGEYDCSADRASVYIYDGEERVYQLSLTLEEEGYISTNLYTVSGGHNTNTTPGQYYNMADIQVLEINLDNWEDYFAELEQITISTDVFGDITDMTVYHYLALKEEYGYAISGLSEVYVEYTVAKERRMITADLEAQTYQWGETTFDNGEETHTRTMSNYRFEEVEEEHFALPSITSFTVDEFPEDEVWVSTLQEVLRITGTVYCVPGK